MHLYTHIQPFQHHFCVHHLPLKSFGADITDPMV